MCMALFETEISGLKVHKQGIQKDDSGYSRRTKRGPHGQGSHQLSWRDAKWPSYQSVPSRGSWSSRGNLRLRVRTEKGSGSYGECPWGQPGGCWPGSVCARAVVRRAGVYADLPGLPGSDHQGWITFEDFSDKTFGNMLDQGSKLNMLNKYTSIEISYVM